MSLYYASLNNQQGVPVNRFDIVKALYQKDPLLQQVFKLIGQKQTRREDVLYKPLKGNISFVLKKLETIKRIVSVASQLDKMWERLFEFSLFCQTGQHRKPVEILKGFIRVEKTPTEKLSSVELARPHRVSNLSPLAIEILHSSR
jgi:hypothetical protein